MNATGIIINVSAELVTEICPRLGCGILYAVPKDLQERRKKDHAPFYCPNGHNAVYSGETEEQKKIRELEKEKELMRADRDVWAEDCRMERQAREQSQRQHAATKGVLTRTRKQIAKGKCPCCDLLFIDLRGHMGRKHPGYVTAAGEP